MQSGYRLAILAVAAAGLIASPPTLMAEESQLRGQAFDSWLEGTHLSGDWGGARTWLDERGITFELSYAADFFYNTRGGLNTSDADQYRGLMDATLTLDTEAMGLWEGGTFFFDFQQIHGRDISERHVGDIQALNNNDAPDRTQLAEYWYEHSIWDGKLRIKLGKMDSNADFAYVDYGLEHIHSSAGFPPVKPMPTYPDPAIGAAVFVEPVDWLCLSGGIYDGDGLGDRTGFDTAFHGRDDSVTFFELGLQPTFTIGNQELPGRYTIGGWYHSGEWDVIFDDRDGELPPRVHRGNSGGYLIIDQLLYRENPEEQDDEQGLGGFFQFAAVPSEYNPVSSYYGFGGQYVGLLPGRDDDVTGLGFYHVSFSGTVQSLQDLHSETAIELFHKFQLTEFVSIKPDVQYIVNPGGNGRDALVVGARVEIAF
jgi:porin